MTKAKAPRRSSASAAAESGEAIEVPDEIALFDAPSATGCAFGTHCLKSTYTDATLDECKICYSKLHHLCSIKCPVISEVVSESGSCCFDCAAMLGLTQTNSLVGSAPMQKYYAQIDCSTPQPQNSRTIGALMAKKALNDGNVWDEDQNGECHVCDNEEDDDESPMLVCSF